MLLGRGHHVVYHDLLLLINKLGLVQKKTDGPTLHLSKAHDLELRLIRYRGVKINKVDQNQTPPTTERFSCQLWPRPSIP